MQRQQFLSGFGSMLGAVDGEPVSTEGDFAV